MKQLSASCPGCGTSLLAKVHFKAVEVEACPECGGLWFDAGELSAVVKDSVGSAPQRARQDQALRESHVVCPDCHVQTRVHALGPALMADPPEVHLCASCEGCWLERGQLEAIHHAEIHGALEKDISFRNWLFQLLLQLPIEFNVKVARRPVVTYLLVAANVAMMALMLFGPGKAILQNAALFPANYPDRTWLLALLSHPYLHGGLLHLGMNMYFLWVLGDNVEDALGHAGYLLFYTIAGVIGGLCHTLIDAGSTIPMVGASGAISAVIAAYAVFFRKARLTFMIVFIQIKLRAPYYMLIWVALNLLGLALKQGGVAWGAHLGGFFFGLLVAVALDRFIVGRNRQLQLMRRYPG